MIGRTMRPESSRPIERPNGWNPYERSARLRIEDELGGVAVGFRRERRPDQSHERLIVAFPDDVRR